ncbi:MAG TPA: type II secretion system F family protein [Patescibacteria group bacterium]|nr:type II secretion system F family protein [Patescibacteria group bacterium]
MLFKYKATNKQGASVSGKAEAQDKAGLLTLLHKQGLHPIVIEADKSKGFNLFAPKKKVKLGDLVIFTRQLSTMISAGVPLARSLAALQTDSENPYMKEVIGSVNKDVESGMALGSAFEKFPNVFSEVYINMVKAGEEGGILDDILKRLATQVEQDASIRKKIKSAMMYPIVILSITIIAFFGIMLFIMPKLENIFATVGGSHYKLPVYTKVLLEISNFSAKPTLLGPLHIPIISNLPNLILMLVVFLIGLVFLLRYIKTPNGKYQFHSILLRIPVIKILVLKVAIARFSRTFASLMGSGVSVLDSLAVTGKALGNKVIEKELAAAAVEVKNGKPLSVPIAQSKHFPPIVSQMLSVGEETGQIDTVLVKIADFYEEEVAVLNDGLAAIIEPIMIVFLGAGVGLIAASVMGSIANLSRSIGTGS